MGIEEPQEDGCWVRFTLVWEPEDGSLMGFRRVRLNGDYN